MVVNVGFFIPSGDAPGAMKCFPMVELFKMTCQQLKDSIMKEL